MHSKYADTYSQASATLASTYYDSCLEVEWANFVGRHLLFVYKRPVEFAYYFKSSLGRYYYLSCKNHDTLYEGVIYFSFMIYNYFILEIVNSILKLS